MAKPLQISDEAVEAKTRTAAIQVDPDRVSVGLDVPRFATVTIRGWDIVDGPPLSYAKDGNIVIERWGKEKVEEYHRCLRGHELAGRPAVIIAEALHRQVRGGVVGRLLGLLDAPLERPKDREVFVLIAA